MGNTIEPFQFDCSTENKICSGGKCITPTTTCTDSDGGKVYDVKGTVTVGSTTYTDECITGFLIEYFCNNNINQYEGYQCPSGQSCSNGACVGGTTTCSIPGDSSPCNCIINSELQIIANKWKTNQGVSNEQIQTAAYNWKNNLNC
jgi:hypothetical protein